MSSLPFAPARNTGSPCLTGAEQEALRPTEALGLAAPITTARSIGTVDALRLALDRIIATIDSLVSAQLDAVLHHTRLRRLEGSWRGLAWLAEKTASTEPVRLKILNLHWRELCRDLARATEFDRSQIFRKIYEEEFGMPGGEPYGLLVVDHEARHRPSAGTPTDDVSALTSLAGVAAAAFVPTVVAASPALLQVDHFADLALAGELADPFRSDEFARWRGLSRHEDMRFIAVTLPRVLARPSWTDDPARCDGWRYVEKVSGPEEMVWMTAGFACAAVVVRAFVNHNWPADIRGAETDRLGGGLVTDMPAEPFPTDANWFRSSLDISLSDRQERALINAGLMPLSALPFGQEAVFGGVRTLHAPPRFAGPSAAVANANARFSSQLNSMLCVSRFAHYVKLLGRSAIGAFRTAEDIEKRMHDWLQFYVNPNLSTTGDTRARFPLAAAQVSVRENAGKPGTFACTVHLQPHFQLDGVSATFRMVTDFAAPAS
jgi:type VI secretion system ImpC/EvpB family protein